jgi:hypothetical protein
MLYSEFIDQINEYVNLHNFINTNIYLFGEDYSKTFTIFTRLIGWVSCYCFIMTITDTEKIFKTNYNDFCHSTWWMYEDFCQTQNKFWKLSFSFDWSCITINPHDIINPLGKVMTQKSKR